METSYIENYTVRHRYSGAYANFLTVKFDNPQHGLPQYGLIKAYPADRLDIVRNEFKVMKAAANVTHAVCTPYSLFKAGEHWMLAMENIDGVRLSEFADQLGDAKLQEKVLMFIQQLVEALHAMNTNNLHHCNLQAEHVIIEANDRVRLIGFGRSKISPGGKSDVKSLGLMVLKLILKIEYSLRPGDIGRCLIQLQRALPRQVKLHEFLSIACTDSPRSNFEALYALLSSPEAVLYQSSDSAQMPRRQCSSLHDTVEIERPSIESEHSEGRAYSLHTHYYQPSTVQKTCTSCMHPIDNLELISLQCDHNFHLRCLGVYITGLLKTSELYTSIVCPFRCSSPFTPEDIQPATIPFQILLNLKLDNESVDKLRMLQELGISAQCPKCDKFANQPMFNRSKQAYRINCDNCGFAYCSYCNEKNFHFFGKCKKLKRMLKRRK